MYYRILIAEIDAIDLGSRPLPKSKPLSDGEEVVGTLGDTHLKHWCLVSETEEVLKDINSKIDDVSECHQVDHSDKTGAELKKACGTYAEMIKNLLLQRKPVMKKFMTLKQMFDSEVEESFASKDKEYDSFVLREGGIVVGVSKTSADQSVGTLVISFATH